MESLSILLAAVIILVILKISSKSRKAKLLDALPGPPSLPIVGNFFETFVAKEELMSISNGWYDKYGPIYRTWLGPIGAVHVCKAEYVETLLSSTKNLRKGKIYDLLHPWLGTGLLTSYGSKWFAHRKMITPTFHFKILDTFIDVFNENSKILIKSLQTKSVSGEVFDIFPFITRCALDIICETAMGTRVNAQSQDSSPYVSSIYRVSEITIKRNFYFWLQSDLIFYNTALGKEYKKNVQQLHGFTESVIKERIEQRKLNKNTQVEIIQDDLGTRKKQAFLDLLLDANAQESNKLTDLEIREEVDTFMFEGHDTTTAAICWSIILLGSHEKIQEEVYEELKNIFADDPTRSPTMQDFNEMKYLERVIKEALRLYPSVPFITRKIEEEIMLDDFLIPHGVNAVIHINDLHRDPNAFPEPMKFDPDRFLPENIQTRHPYAYVPFSAGPRNCIGQKFALLEEKTVLSHLIMNYKFETVEKRENLILLIELILRPKSGAKVKITRREV